MEKTLVDNIIKAWAKKMNKDMPLQYELDVRSEPYFTLNLPNGEYVTFDIQEKGDYYQVGILPSYVVTVTADEPCFSLHEVEVDDFEGYVDNLYESMSNNVRPQWLQDIPLDPPHIRSSNNWILEEYLDEWMNKTAITSEQIIFWYVKEIALPPFLDQTPKHMALAMVDGIESYNIEDACQYWEQQMDEGESIECLLDEVKIFYKGA